MIGELVIKGLESVVDGYKSHMHQILTGICIGGIFTTGITASVATAKSCKKIETIKKERGVEKLSAKEVVKECWPYYIPMAVTMGVSTVAGVKAYQKSEHDNAVLAALLQTAESNRKDILDATEEVVGKKKKEEIEVKAAEKAIAKNPPADDNIYRTKYGEFLFRDSLTGIFFRSSHTAVDKGILEFNKDMANDPDEMDYCFGDIFREWGVDYNDLSQPKIWLLQDTYCTHPVEYKIVDGHHPITGEPCATIVWIRPPFDRESLLWHNEWYD